MKQTKITESIDLSESSNITNQAEERIIFCIDIIIGPNIKERLVLKEGEIIKDKVDDFSIKYNLNDNEKLRLIEMINSKVDGFLDSIVEESKTNDQNY